MGLLENALVGGGLAWLGRSAYRNAQETRRRKSSPLSFDDGLSQQAFVEIATAVAKRTPRVTGIDVVGMTVDLHYKSNTGLTEWYAEVDFNDYGHLTGAYWIRAENSDSQIPSHFANALSAQVEARAATCEPEEDGQAQDRGSSGPPQSAPPGWYPTETGLRYWNGMAWTQDRTPTDSSAYLPRFIATSSSPHAGGQVSIMLAWIITLATFGYMLPWAIAVTRGTANRGRVGWVCFVTGWTVIGWTIALVMACSS